MCKCLGRDLVVVSILISSLSVIAFIKRLESYSVFSLTVPVYICPNIYKEDEHIEDVLSSTVKNICQISGVYCGFNSTFLLLRCYAVLLLITEVSEQCICPVSRINLDP